MIPIKWNGTNWVITTAEDPEWYNYASGNFANIMLSDGYYKSELQRGITDDQLVSNNIGNDPIVVSTDKLGSIFTWLPRFAYLDEQILYLNGTSVLEYNWTTASCFNLEQYGANALDLGFNGIWIGKKEYSNIAEVRNKNNEMNTEENIQGLIANEKVSTITSSEIIAIQKFEAQYSTTNATRILNESTATQNRQVIKIINTNKKLPIVVNHSITTENIIIEEKYSKNGIKFVLDKNGNKLDKNTTEINDEETQYTFYIVDNIGNIRKYNLSYTVLKPDKSKFNKNVTFYVTYDEETGEEQSIIPIGEKAPGNWYNYDNQQWANVVVRDRGNENYFVWIPRYMYKINNDGSETVDAKFVDLENIWTDPNDQNKKEDLNDSEYKLPDAFTWEDPENGKNKVQLKGFWIGKYKLREGSIYVPTIYGSDGKIRVKDVIENVGTDYKYEMYLIKDGKRIIYNESSGEYIEGTTPIELNGDYTFTNVPQGNYGVNIVVKDNSGKYIKSIAREVIVGENLNFNKPDISEFNKNLTYYVTYNEVTGVEESSIPIGEKAPENWYDYDDQKWANIVVRENGLENYFVWIPRYEYAVDSALEKTMVNFIPTSQVTADDGYIIPDAFSWEKTNANGTTEKVNLPGFWISKYKLRAGESYRLDAAITAGTNKIRVSNIVATSNEINFTAYLIKDGKVLESKYMLASGDITFDTTNYGYGKYSVLVKQWSTTNGMVAGVSKEVEIQKLHQPDLTGFNVDMTYIVTYSDDGTENTQKVADILNADAEINADKTLKTGKIDESKINGIWYDYSSQKWANIVTIDEETGNTNYFVWIPRYQYATISPYEKTKVDFISVDKLTAEPGAQIPDAFTWEKTNANGTTEKVNLPGFWISKYKLRAGK